MHNFTHYLTLLVLLLCNVFNLFAQEKDSLATEDTNQETALSVWGYGDIYFAYNFNNKSGTIGDMQSGNSSIYSFNRNNEFNLNNGIIGIKYDKDNIRASFSLHAGTYVNANYASEPGVIKNVFDAAIGYKLGKKLWVDAGIFASHIGSESALSYDNLTLSRSMMADNTPYYETGIKLLYQATNKLTITGLLLNGWQNIYDRNRNKAIGTQLQYKAKDDFLINWSTFIGKEVSAYETIPASGSTDSLSTQRFFSDFFIQGNISKKLIVLIAFDIGIQQKRIGSGNYVWYNPNFIARYTIAPKVNISGRIEYYYDKNGVIIYSGTPAGFQTYSGSLNLDYKLADNILWRIEGRVFQSKDKIYKKEDTASDNLVLVLSSLAVKF